MRVPGPACQAESSDLKSPSRSTWCAPQLHSHLISKALWALTLAKSQLSATCGVALKTLGCSERPSSWVKRSVSSQRPNRMRTWAPGWKELGKSMMLLCKLSCSWCTRAPMAQEEGQRKLREAPLLTLQAATKVGAPH